MPTVFTKNGFRFFFYSEEGNEPIHLHVAYGDALAKFWIEPDIILASNIGLKSQEIRRARKLIEEHKSLITQKWNEYEARRKNL